MADEPRFLWEAIEPVYGAILEHPFLKGLTSGTLPEASFRHYVLQDAIYLRGFGRGLAVLGAKSEDDDSLIMFCEHAANAIVVERALHRGFLEAWNLELEDCHRTEPAPNCLFYTSYLLRVAYERPYHEALGAFLPCYWIYREVGLALQEQGSPHPLYQRWIDTYGGDEFGAVVRAMLETVETAMKALTTEQKAAVARHFKTTSRLEYLFWDMGYHGQEWPV